MAKRARQRRDRYQRISTVSETRALENPTAPQTILGTPGFTIYGGFLQEKDTDALLTGQRRHRTFSEALTNTAIVAASVRYFLNMTATARWQVRTPDDKPASREVVEFVESVMDRTRTPWPRIVRRTAMYRLLGYSLQEWTMVRREDDGALGFLDIQGRPQHTIYRWDIGQNGQVLGVEQQPPQTYETIYIPRNRLVYAVDDSISDSPEGLGLLRHVVPYIEILKRYQQLELFGFETDLRGVPFGTAPLSELQALVEKGQLTEAQKEAILYPMKEFIQRHIKGPNNGILLDSDPYRDLGQAQAPSQMRKFTIDLLDANVTSQGAVGAAVERINTEIARILNTEQLLLGANSRGSFALSRDKTGAFLQMVNATLEDIGATYTRDLITPLWKLNGRSDPMPRLVPDLVRHKDVKDMAESLKQISLTGVTLGREDPAIQEYFHLLGLTPPKGLPAEESLKRQQQLLGGRPANPENDLDGDGRRDDSAADDDNITPLEEGEK